MSAPYKVGDTVWVRLKPSGWQPGHVVSVRDEQVRVLLDVPKRSMAFSDGFAAGFDSNGLAWLPANDPAMRYRAIR